tara:strand:+ start:6330 stop:7091 length:762 start_codon:yes stop_codon:yes gene_type:complete
MYKYNFIILSIIVIILITFIFIYSESYCGDLRLNIINFNPEKSKKIVIISGVHGNEYAPPIGVSNFISQNTNNLTNSDYHIVFIPRVNEEGLIQKRRYLPCMSTIIYNHDINRNFYTETEKILNETSLEKQIINIIQDTDFVLDFHEAYDFHKIKPSSIGSTISISNNGLPLTMANKLVYDINETIDDPNKKFTVISIDKYNIPHTLRDYCEKKMINYNLVEITGQNNKQPLNLRVNQTQTILNSLFENISII